MLKFFAILTWIAVGMLVIISLGLVLLENWAGVLISCVIAPAIGIAMKVTEEAGL